MAYLLKTLKPLIDDKNKPLSMNEILLVIKEGKQTDDRRSADGQQDLGTGQLRCEPACVALGAVDQLVHLISSGKLIPLPRNNVKDVQ